MKFYNELTKKIDFSNKTVLEIGGSNTPVEVALKEIGAKKWVCVDKISESHFKLYHAHYCELKIHTFKDIQSSIFDVDDEDYIIFNEYAERVPDSFYDKFDVVISNLSFEHIIQLPTVLDKIYKALRKDGILYAVFSSIWSAPTGTHLSINDSINDFSWSIIEKNYPKEMYHAHLLMGYMEIYEYLSKIYSDEIAQKYAYLIKNGVDSYVNRLFYEDYVYLVNKTQFSKKAIFPASVSKMESQKMKMLQQRYPGYKRFDVRGAVIEAIK